MPLILIIVGVLAALVLGFVYTQSQSEGEIEIEAPSIRVEETTPSTESPTTNTETSVTTDTAPAMDDGTSDLSYKNGAYDATATYVTPGRSSHNVNVSVTLVDDTITASTVTFTGDDNRTSTGWQSKFAAAYQAQVVGKKIDDVSLTRVGGASLTTGAFNKAIAEVKTSAQS